jgi:TPR repeat protein
MRTSEGFVSVCVLTFGLCIPAYSFDGTTSENGVAPAVSVDVVNRGAVTSSPMNVPAPALASPSQNIAIPNPVLGIARPRPFDPSRKPSAMEAFRSGTQSLRAGDVKGGISALEYAASNGHAVAQWKLGRIYAEGDGVTRDELRAFEYFRDIADAHADDAPGTPQSHFVANAFVALGQYYLDGIPNTAVKADPERAREMFQYAASYFGDADAQFYLGRIYAEGIGVQKDGRLAARWLGLAANKNQHQAQAMLGGMLFKGDAIPRQAARGLMLLTLASDSAQQQETWIRDLHDSAFKQATDDERQLALLYLERRLNGGRP